MNPAPHNPETLHCRFYRNMKGYCYSTAALCE